MTHTTIRIHELAKLAGVKSAELIEKLQAEGITVKNHMSVLDAETAHKMAKKLGVSLPGGDGKAHAAPAPEGKEGKKAAEHKPKAAAAEHDKTKHAPGKEAAAHPAAKTHAPAAAPEKAHAAAAHVLAKEAAHAAKAAPHAAPAKETHAAHAAPHTPHAGHGAHTSPAHHATHAGHAEKPHAEKAAEAAATAQAPVVPAEAVAEPVVSHDAKVIRVNKPIQLKVLAEKMGVKPQEIIKALIAHGVFASITQMLDLSAVDLAARSMGFRFDKDLAMPKPVVEKAAQPAEVLKTRPPVVTIMGHVDHGKTTLLDHIKSTHVADKEFGGITQHIGAYTVRTPRGTIVFMDTPGHEAFTALRARGANLTDICVLVVAADDGVMQQTIEALNHAKAAKVPVIVAINKMDRPGANPDGVKKQLLAQELVSEDLGGETICVPVSAITGQGVDHLIEMILLQAELMELKGAPDHKPVRAVVVESKLCKGLGPVVTAIVREGTLRLGTPVVCDCAYGKIKSMKEPGSADIREAGPSFPVEISGLNEVPEPGSVLEGCADERQARELGEQRLQARRQVTSEARPTTLTWQEQFKQAENKEMRILLRTDVQGSLEAIVATLSRLSTQAVGLKIVHKGVGDIVESDIMLASASQACVVGFNVKYENRIRDVAKRSGVEIKLYRIIYDLIDDIKKILTGMVEPEAMEVVQGRVQVREIFNLSKAGNVLGCYVQDGKVTRKSRIRVVRGGNPLAQTRMSSLKRFKEEVREVAAGFECGIKLENMDDVVVGDVLEAFILEVKAVEGAEPAAK